MLKLIITGHGTTRGRRPHLIRLKESLVRELKTVADGQMYLLIEVALHKMIEDLKKQTEVEIISVEALNPGPLDLEMLEEHEEKMKSR